MKKFYFSIVIILFSISLQGQQASIEKILNPDGTIKTGSNGSFSAEGYTIEPEKGTGVPMFKKNSSTETLTLIPAYPSNAVKAIAVSGTDVYFGGFFTSIGGISATYVAKWDGKTWSALDHGTNSYVLALAVHGNDLYVGGRFQIAGSRFLAKWDGTTWSSLGAPPSGGSGGDDFSYVQALAVNGDDLYVGGDFTSIGGIAANNIAKYRMGVWSPLGTGSNGVVFAIDANDEAVYAGGSFSTMGGIVVNNIAKWSGGAWSAMGSGANVLVSCIHLKDSDVYAGGGFTTMNGVLVNYIAKWSSGTWFALGSGADNPVYSISSYGDDVYASGGFDHIGGIAAAKIAKWSNNSWSQFLGGITLGPSTYTIVTTSNYYLVGGNFFEINGQPNTRYLVIYNHLSPPVATYATGISQSSFSANWEACPWATDYLLDVAADPNMTNILPGYLNFHVGNTTAFELRSLTPNSTYYYRLKALGSLGISPYSNIIAATTAAQQTNGKLTITSPKGGEVYKGGSFQTILWRKSGIVVGTILLEYSLDNGITWCKINSKPIAGVLKYNWIVPNANSNQCLVRISNYITRELYDISNNCFTITPGTSQPYVSNYPNPFNPSTRISFSLDNNAFASLKVYNSISQQVAELVNSQLEAGMHEFEFNASKLPSGTYFYNLILNGKSEIHKMMLLK